MKDKRRRYDLEFKKDVVRLSYESSKSVGELAKDMGIAEWSIYRWRKELTASDTVQINQEVVSQAEENKRLRKENAELRLERDILKKAAAIFAKK